MGLTCRALLLLSLACLVFASYNRLEHISSVDEYLSICEKSSYQKESPSPEQDLGVCSAWKSNSCCTRETADKIANGTFQGFNMHVCNATMSDECLNFFQKDYCFVECSANVGPWLVQTDHSKLGSERVYNVPLCLSECKAWYKACENDLTCAINWASGEFDWSSGMNQCRKGDKCRPIKDVYGSAINFCERVWDHSWKVISDDEHTWTNATPHCMNISTENNILQNRQMARLQAELIIRRVYGSAVVSSPLFSVSLICLIATMFH